MVLTTSPVKVTGYRQGEKDGKPMTRGDGSPVEFVQYVAEGGDGRERERVLDRSINGDRPDVGATVAMQWESHMEAWSPENSTRVYHREKFRVVAFSPVKA